MRTILSWFRLFFIGFCALALLAQTRALLGMPLTPGYLDGFVFGGTVFGYHCTHPVRWYKATAWVAGAFAGCCFILWVLSGGNILVAGVPVFLWLAYYGFRRPGRAGLRSWILAKPLTVALAWAWVTVFLPVSMEHWAGALLMFPERSAFILALALAYDVSDIGHDRRHGLPTLARTLDTKSIFSLIFIGLAASGAFVVAAFATGLYNPSEAVLLVISLVFSAWWIAFLLQKKAWEPWHKVLIDALMPLQCALVLLLH